MGRVGAVSHLAVSIIGQDRPGIIAAVSAALAGLGGNLEDSSMTILRGQFAMMLVVNVPATAHDAEHVLAPVAAELGVVATVAEVAEAADHDAAGQSLVLSVHGADRPGIVSRLMGVVAGHGANVTDLTTRLSTDLYVVIADLDLPEGADAAALDDELHRVAGDLGVDVVLRPADPDVL